MNTQITRSQREAIKRLYDQVENAKITRSQREAIKRLYDRSPDGAVSYRAFRRRFRLFFGDYIGAQWCGMFVGIETDGYTHT